MRTSPVFVTLRVIEPADKEEGSWRILLNSLKKCEADDALLSGERILNTCGLGYALKCMQRARLPSTALPLRLYAVWCATGRTASAMQHAALTVAVRHAAGEATDEELSIAHASIAGEEGERDAFFAATVPSPFEAADLAAFASARPRSEQESKLRAICRTGEFS